MKLEEYRKLSITGIYKITNNITNKVYIGQAKNIRTRTYEHIRSSISPNRTDYNYPLHKAFRKYGLDNFDIEVLELCSSDRLDEREQYWISFFNSRKDGYNQTDGGLSSIREIKISKEQIKDIWNLISNTNQPFSEIAKVYGVTDDHISMINLGKVWHNSQLSYPLRSENFIVKYHFGGYYVEQYDKITNELVAVFPTLNAAAKALGSEDYLPHIMRCCAGQRKTAYGYKWKKVEILEPDWLNLFFKAV